MKIRYDDYSARREYIQADDRRIPLVGTGTFAEIGVPALGIAQAIYKTISNEYVLETAAGDDFQFGPRGYLTSMVISEEAAKALRSAWEKVGRPRPDLFELERLLTAMRNVR